MLIDWLKSLRSFSAYRRSGASRLSNPSPLEPRTLLSSVPVGPEFRVNSTTSDGQNLPAIAMDADGDYVIAWRSTGQDGDDYGIYAQRYNAAGTPLGPEFRVNSTITGTQDRPSIAMDADGDFVIAWRSAGQDGDDYGIYAQRYNAAGTPQGLEFRVNSFTTGSQDSPSIAMDSDGDFVIAWQSNGQDGSFIGIYAQRYNAAGVPQGTEFRVNTYTIGTQSIPAIGMDVDGDFVIAWQSFGPDGDGWDIYSQRYNAAGAPQGAEFQVNSTTTKSQASPSIALDSDGDFIIAWDSYGQDGSDYGIYAQRFHAGKPDYLGVRRASQFYLDSNQSDTWSGSTTDTLNSFGTATDKPIVGDWNGDGYDDIGIWRGGTFYLDTNGNGIWNGPTVDKQFVFGNSTDTPLVGDWNKDGKDDVGVWRAGKFYLDLNANRVWNAGVDGIFTFGNPTDTPIVGKFNRDVADDIGVWRAGIFYLDYNSNRKWDGTPTDFRVGFGATTDTPLIGNWRPKTIPGSPPAGSPLPPNTITPTPNPLTSTTTAQPPNASLLATLISPPPKRRDLTI